MASNTRSGFGCSVRPNSGAALARRLVARGTICKPFALSTAAKEELSGVLAVTLERQQAASQVHRSGPVQLPNCPTSDRMRSSFPPRGSALLVEVDVVRHTELEPSFRP